MVGKADRHADMLVTKVQGSLWNGAITKGLSPRNVQGLPGTLVKVLVRRVKSVV
jgi:hypothetical protein